MSNQDQDKFKQACSEEQINILSNSPDALLCGSGGQQSVDEISLVDLWCVVWGRKWHIIGFSLLLGIFAAGYTLTLPNIYRADVLLAPVGGEKGKSGFTSALGGLGGLATLAGIQLPGRGDVEENVAVLKSRDFLLKFVADNNLMPILFKDEWDETTNVWKNGGNPPVDWEAYRLFTQKILTVAVDKKSSLVTVSISWTDPVLAAKWANDLIVRLNNYLREDAISKSKNNLKYLNDALGEIRVEDMRTTLFSLISEEQKSAMLANTQTQFAFRVLDSAKAPDKKTSPQRLKIVQLVTLLSGLVGVIGVCGLHLFRATDSNSRHVFGRSL